MQTNMLLFRLQVIGFLLVFFFLIDTYTWRGIRDLAKKYLPKYIRASKIVFFGMSVLIIVSVGVLLFFPELERFRLPRAIVSGTMVTVIGTKITFLLFVLANDILAGLQWLLRKVLPNKEQVQLPVEEPIAQETDENMPKGTTLSRKQFLYQSGAIMAIAPVYFFSRGALYDAHNYKVRRIKLPSANLPEAFDGLKIVQISDIHSGSFVDKDAVYKGVKMIVDEKPDVFFFTGDMVNTYAYEMNDYLDVFSPIKAPMGSYSSLGNHDYGDYARNWKSPEEKAQNLQDLFGHHKNLNWQLLNNDHVVLDRRGQKLGIIGVENWGSKARFPKYGDMEKAQKGMPATPYKILLSHDPSHWDAVVRPQYKDIDLMLAGHTHGMQFGIENKFIKFSPVQWMYKQWAGLYTQGNQHLYVNRGYGYIGYPGRVGILPEITVIELVKA